MTIKQQARWEFWGERMESADWGYQWARGGAGWDLDIYVGWVHIVISCIC